MQVSAKYSLSKQVAASSTEWHRLDQIPHEFSTENRTSWPVLLSNAVATYQYVHGHHAFDQEPSGRSTLPEGRGIDQLKAGPAALVVGLPLQGQAQLLRDPLGGRLPRAMMAISR